MSSDLDLRPKTKKEVQAKIKEAISSSHSMMFKGGSSFIFCIITSHVFVKALSFVGFRDIGNFQDVIFGVFTIMAVLGGIQFIIGLFMKGIAPLGYDSQPLNAETTEKLDLLSAKYPEVKYVLSEWKKSEVGLLDGDLTRIENFIKEKSPAVSGENPAIKLDYQAEQNYEDQSWRIKPSKKTIRGLKRGYFDEN